jgi:hypothetical protein
MSSACSQAGLDNGNGSVAGYGTIFSLSVGLGPFHRNSATSTRNGTLSSNAPFPVLQ